MSVRRTLLAATVLVLACCACEHHPRKEGGRALPSLARSMSAGSGSAVAAPADAPPSAAGEGETARAADAPPVAAAAPDAAAVAPAAAVVPAPDAAAVVVAATGLTCKDVGDHIQKLMAAGTIENLPDFPAALTGNCTQNAWPPEVVSCVVGVTKDADLQACETLLNAAMLARAQKGPQAAGEPSCVKVVPHILEVAAVDDPGARDAVQATLLDACNKEPWSIAARECFLKATTPEDSTTCSKLVNKVNVD